MTLPVLTSVEPVEQSRVRRVLPVLGLGIGVAALTWALHVRDPHSPGSWGFCPTALMGFACPGCGSLRAVHHLTDLDVAAAAASNLLLVVAAPVALVWWVWALVRSVRGVSRPWAVRVPVWTWWVLGALTLVFTVLRNTPAGAWLAP